MSLLLDALKKAEKEKLKARKAEAAAVEQETRQPNKELLENSSEEQSSTEKSKLIESDDLELTLDEAEVSQKESEVEEAEMVSEVMPPMDLEKVSATTSTVSDEALHLLVYKINKKYRQRQKKIWGGLLAVTAIILVTVGSYYYYGMLEEVDALERKHKIAMRSVRAEPIKIQQAGETVKPVMIEQVEASEASSVQKTEAPVALAVAVRNKVSVVRSDAEDPINTLLRNAWEAYNRSDYPTAKRDYEKVLNQEPKNRDALLGVAAVAVKNADYKKAGASYQLLLKLDPRDQIAKAAITNLNELTSNYQDESQLKFMLQQQPSATHLNFALGNYYARKLQWPEAQAEYFKAWQGDASNADYAYNLAVSLDQLGKAKQALQFYKESLLLSHNKNISFSKVQVEKRIQQISVK